MRISDWSSDVCSSDLTPDWTSRLHFHGFASFGVAVTDADDVNYNPHAASSSSSFAGVGDNRSEENTSELQSLMRISYAGFCLIKKKRVIMDIARRKTTTTNQDTSLSYH